MNRLATIRALGPVDLRSVWRDPMLRWLVFLPLALALVLRFLAKPLLGRLAAWLEVDLAWALTPLVGYIVLVLAPTITGMVIGFLLLDHRDEGTLAALGVTPLTHEGYLAYRLTVPMLIAFAATLLTFPLAGVAVSPAVAVLSALAAAPAAPLFALFLAGFARNKVQGFALMKAAGVVLWPPLAGLFVAMPWQLLFGVSPFYWPGRVYWSALESDACPAGGGPTELWALWMVPGLAWQGLLVWLLLRRYRRVMQT